MKLGTEYNIVQHWMRVGIGLIALVMFCYSRDGVWVFFLAFLILLTIASRQQKTYSIVLEDNMLVLTGAKLLIRNVVSYHVQDIWLELIHSGSTGEAKDAILNVFEGKKCVRQVHVKEGYTEEEFKNLITAFYVMKTSTPV
ncbi:hypothetical protein [Chitinophaga pinensis]|uniref:Uncharacterized protein n=1 Tax=Chitinophaga pinensis (strain ATCC 43595 / DSM 2588 / LMG 13176 / NBRC 15968 / NCIMB 11800 / UQM 2034) TaxID=485918 RepID=A0A979G7X1_CHIPD|nr:hypothetical protein [Chitinophaga pinensis]ACU62410.1 hypothetical protein Cpin_4977 [Chitinophaga pinensis DSM 2588]